ncbi:hypothetical protein Htur_0332 [Haloterrigena turkmenica DSM 5511]|uniref:HTH iclR-type domain-containing protein n=1 Tax=Haloterrigena turkmenica (strain ATCC 51198 / DSM 5511 / JCM 9101 / NCIMB 13204 / VKM B-1734 / 4k) TaxID=543526 RepID=D2RUU0_HALTV|nr:hypothetical protein [Haloterrigena turkmenica]ADB59233.1 hypothetical protein Htur_0332 [Haloterrigena turkmenica DSM 5511]
MDLREQGRWALFWVLVGIGCMLVATVAVPIGAAADAGSQGVALQDEGSASDRLDEADEILIDVFVHENGSATFVVDYRFENQTDEEWGQLSSDVQSNQEVYADSQEDRWNDILREGENATDRDMAIENVTVATDNSSAPREMGHVVVTFEWDSFAYPQLTQIEAGSALVGLSLPSGTWLQVYAPEGYTIDEVSPEPEGDGGSVTGGSEDSDLESVRWGDAGDPFSSTPPTIVMIEESNETDPSTEADPGTDGPRPWLLVLGALALLATVGAAGWWLRGDRAGDRSASVTNGGSTTNGNAAAPEDEMPPPELLSNEERVLQLLEKRGGRIKQQEVVSELDWTEAKTSQVVSGLREDGEIDVFRIGRENVLALPDGEDEE